MKNFKKNTEQLQHYLLFLQHCLLILSVSLPVETSFGLEIGRAYIIEVREAVTIIIIFDHRLVE